MKCSYLAVFILPADVNNDRSCGRCFLFKAWSIEGNGYETRQSSLLYVIVLFFGLDPAQNTIVVYSELGN